MNIPAHDPNRGRWIPWIFVGGMAVVVVVNGVLIFSALSTFTGVTVSGAYDRGRSYNQVLREAERQEALGWNAQVLLAETRVIVTLTDRAGAPVAGHLASHMLRPLDGERVDLPDLTSAGRFALDLPALRAGQWEYRGLLTAPDGARRDIRERLILP